MDARALLEGDDNRCSWSTPPLFKHHGVLLPSIFAWCIGFAIRCFVFCAVWCRGNELQYVQSLCVTEGDLGPLAFVTCGVPYSSEQCTLSLGHCSARRDTFVKRNRGVVSVNFGLRTLFRLAAQTQIILLHTLSAAALPYFGFQTKVTVSLTYCAQLVSGSAWNNVSVDLFL